MSAPPRRAPRVQLAASLLAAPVLQLGHALQQLQAAGLDELHLDVMDGHFVGNIEGSVRLAAAVTASCPLPLEVHLMVAHPERWVAAYVRAQAAAIVVHVEAAHDVTAILAALRQAGGDRLQVGLSLCPDTDVQQLRTHLPQLQRVQVMSVQPGRSGQAFMPAQLAKVERLACWRQAGGGTFDIGIDGGIDAASAQLAVAAGAQRLVVGAALWPGQTPSQGGASLRRAVAELRAAAALGACAARPDGHARLPAPCPSTPAWPQKAPLP